MMNAIDQRFQAAHPAIAIRRNTGQNSITHAPLIKLICATADANQQSTLASGVGTLRALTTIRRVTKSYPTGRLPMRHARRRRHRNHTTQAASQARYAWHNLMRVS